MKIADIIGAVTCAGSARANARLGRTLGVLALLLATAIPATAVAAEVSREQEWGTRVKEREDVAALTSNVFGDKINLVDGKGAFAVTDVSIPGNSSLPVAVSRKIELGTPLAASPTEMFGDWAINLPYLAGLHGADPSFYWAHTGTDGLKRCSVGVYPMSGTNRLVLPGGGGGALLERIDTPKHVLPQIAGLSPWVTKDNWYFTCLSNIQYGNGNGEGFVGISPDGLRYTFAWMTVHDYPGTTLPDLQGEIQVLRREIRLNVTQVDDQFGNWVKYNWGTEGLKSIESNDGRRIDLEYESNNVKRVRANGQTYTYEYANEANLTGLVNPDGSRWTYDQQVPALVPYKEEMESYNCRANGDTGVTCDFRIKKELVAFCSWSDYLVANDYVFAITAPSGATGRFKFRPTRHGRAWVPRDCQFPDYETVGGVHWRGRSWNRYQAYYDAFSLVEKQITGPGLAPQTWTYTYAGNEPSYVPFPNSGETYTPHYKTVTVLEPDSTKVVNTFGKDYGINEGQLTVVEIFDAGNVLKRRSTYSYVSEAEAATAPFPTEMGYVVTPDEDADGWGQTAIRPQREVVIAQDGVTARSTIDGFDAFARPLRTTRSSAALPPPPLPPPPPLEPANLSVERWVDESQTPNQIVNDVTWSASSGATSYDLQGQFGANPAAIVYSGPNLSYQRLGAGTHTYWVRACNAQGCSSWKGPVSP